MANTRPDSRLYALLHRDMGKGEGDAVPLSTTVWVCCKKNRQNSTYLLEKWQ